jgi:hypothetical protein
LIKRTWRIWNWCQYSASLPLTIVPNPAPIVNLLAPENLVGPLVGDATVSTKTKIKYSDPDSTNYSTFWAPDANGFWYQQMIYVFDTTAPVMMGHTPPSTCDAGANDPTLWRGLGWYNPADSTDDQAEAAINIELTVTDECGGGDVVASYMLFLDLDADGTQETFVMSGNPPPPGSILFDNVATQGIQRQYDRRLLAIDKKYVFALQKNTTGDTTKFLVRWNTMADPNVFNMPQLPYGYHRIVWTVSDRCGNSKEYEQAFTISNDCAAPSVACESSISVMIPGLGPDSTTVHVSEVFLAALDNVTAPLLIEKAIERTPFGSSFPEWANGLPQDSVIFDCSDVGYRTVRVWARDAFGNAAHCTTTVSVTDPEEVCISYQPAVSGTAHNLKNQLVPLEFDLYRMPDTVLVATANNWLLDFYFFNDLDLFGNYFVRPRAESSDILNGVNTFDLILISRHILNLEPFDTPYKLIAGDANASGTVTNFDIVTLRKIILGTLTSLPGNTSWRFVPQDHQFPVPENPFGTPFPEQINLPSVYTTVVNANFFAIKIGDVDYSASPIPATGAPDDRNDWPIGLEVEVATAEMRDGRTPIYVTATEPLSGLQLALEMPQAAQFLPVLADEEYFSLANGVLSVVLDKYEATIGQKQLLGWVLGESTVRIGQTPTLYPTAFGPNGAQRSIILLPTPPKQSGGRLTLQPNPATDRATLAFGLENDGIVEIEVRNCNQQRIKSVILDKKAGHHQFELETAHWPNGVYSVSIRSRVGVETLKLLKM